MFSRKMVLELEDVVQNTARKVLGITQEAIDANKPVDLHHAFRCVSVDVISEYAFDQSYNLLDTPDLGGHFFTMIRGLGPAFYAFQQFPAMGRLALSVPPSLSVYLGGSMKQVTNLQQEGVRQLESVKSRMEAGELSTRRPTIFSELLDPEKQEEDYPVPPPIKLKDEVFSILAAAADTTGNAMTVAAYHVLKSREIYAAVRQELFEAYPDPSAKLEFQKLERLPYLTAVIKEALR
jgi:cytochrome P450